ncbi:hypothetical protein [Xanthomonas sp. MUS 060]|nr:hypothetical protein [Xanthomonas sp. MUS 060]
MSTTTITTMPMMICCLRFFLILKLGFTMSMNAMAANSVPAFDYRAKY